VKGEKLMRDVVTAAMVGVEGAWDRRSSADSSTTGRPGFDAPAAPPLASLIRQVPSPIVAWDGNCRWGLDPLEGGRSVSGRRLGLWGGVACFIPSRPFGYDQV